MKIKQVGYPISTIVSNEYFKTFPDNDHSEVESSVVNAKVLSKFLLFWKSQKNINKDPIPKLIKFKSLKNGRTTIENDSGNKKYFYHPLNKVDNPFVTKCINRKKGYDVELILDPGNSVIYMPVAQMTADDIQNNIFDSDANHVTRYTDNSSDSSSTEQVSRVVTGKIKITVYSESNRMQMFLSNLDINLKCFTNEYIDITNPSTENNSDICSEFLDEFDKKMSCYKGTTRISLDMMNYKIINKKISQGVYEFPFEFTLDCKDATDTRCHYGSVQYRLEAISKIFYEKDGNFDTVILTDNLEVRKVIPIEIEKLVNSYPVHNYRWSRAENSGKSVLLKSFEEYLNFPDFNDSLKIDIMTSSRILSKSSPMRFTALMEIDMNLKNFFITKLSLCLCQYISLPSIDYVTFKPVKNSDHIRSGDDYILDVADLTKFTFSNNELKYNFEIDDLSSKLADKSTLSTFYCEKSTIFSDVASLKITHKLIFKIYILPITKKGTRKLIREYCVRVPVPIILVDDDMSNGLALPTYENKIEPLTNI